MGLRGFTRTDAEFRTAICRDRRISRVGPQGRTLPDALRSECPARLWYRVTMTEHARGSSKRANVKARRRSWAEFERFTTFEIASALAQPRACDGVVKILDWRFKAIVPFVVNRHRSPWRDDRHGRHALLAIHRYHEPVVRGRVVPVRTRPEVRRSLRIRRCRRLAGASTSANRTHVRSLDGRSVRLPAAS